MGKHAAQNAYDRAIGEAWEARFEAMARDLGWECARAVAPEVWWKKSEPLPDRTVRRDGKREWHEIKHKDPTRWTGEFGLEGYRMNALLHLAEVTGDPVLYTIHDWRLAGASSSDEDVENRLRDWRTVEVAALQETESRSAEGFTYYSGQKVRTKIYYWRKSLWAPLATYWNVGSTVATTAPEFEMWPDGINPYVTPERRAEIVASRTETY